MRLLKRKLDRTEDFLWLSILSFFQVWCADYSAPGRMKKRVETRGINFLIKSRAVQNSKSYGQEESILPPNPHPQFIHGKTWGETFYKIPSHCFSKVSRSWKTKEDGETVIDWGRLRRYNNLMQWGGLSWVLVQKRGVNGKTDEI